MRGKMKSIHGVVNCERDEDEDGLHERKDYLREDAQVGGPSSFAASSRLRGMLDR